MTITLTTIGSRTVTLTPGPSVLPEAAGGIVLELTLHDGPLILTLTRDEARALTGDRTRPGN